MSDDLVKREYLIFKAGRGWYRPDSKGYTSFKFDAGRYSEDEAKRITNPNGLGGPRDGMRYKHESEVHDYPSDRIEELEAKLADAQWLLCDAAVQLREGLIKTRRNRADLIDTFLAELKGEKDE